LKFELTRLLLVLTLSVVSAAPESRVVASTAALPSPALAVEQLTPEEAGRQIFVEADRRNSGYVDLEVDLQMILRSPRGVANERLLRIKQLEVPQDGDKILLVFDSPADVRGTALLSHAHKVADDDQWLFLPALKRVKKIASQNRGRPFVGSEFSFEDLSTPEVEKYTYLYLGEEALNGLPCYVVQRVSKHGTSAYSKELFWIDQQALRVQQVEYFDPAGRLEKRLQVDDYQLYGTHWKAHRMQMQNLQTQRSTELLWHDYKFQVGLDDNRDFSVNSLRRVR
jgi:outer membrane lipoprotein-sorting protein